MKRSLNKILVYTLIYSGIIIYDEILLRWICKLEFTLFPFVFALLLGFGFAVITSLFKHTRIVMGVISFIILLLYGTQIFYFLFFGTYFMVFSLLNATQVVTVFYGEIIILIRDNLWLLFLCLLPFLVFIGLKRYIVEKKYTLKATLIYSLVWLLLFGLGIGSVYLTSHKENTTYDALVYHPEPESSMLYLGAAMTIGVDITRLLVDNIPFIENAVRTPDVIDPDPDPDPDPTPITYKDNVLPIPFDTMIANTSNKKLIALSSYFKGKTPTKQNIMTGKYKGYNLILITAESFSYFSARQDITPTLYNMVHNGYYFPNFYTPIWRVSTSDGEYVQFTGMIPKDGVWSMFRTTENNMNFVMGNMLKNLGYTTYAFHDGTYTYYDRNFSHPNLGYEYLASGHGLTNQHIWPASDIAMMKETIPMYIDKEPFHVYYMTISGHQNYTWMGNSMANKNKALVQGLDYSELSKGYLATQIELDRAMQYLLEQLRAKGIADNTVIALSADHYPYGLKSPQIRELFGSPIDYFDYYRNNFILYVDGMRPVQMDRLSSSIDILPTLANLFGLPYDSRLFVGQDMFSTASPMVVFVNKSYITDKVEYDASKKTYTWLKGTIADTDYTNRIEKAITAHFYYSVLFLDNDYYQFVENNLK